MFQVYDSGLLERGLDRGHASGARGQTEVTCDSFRGVPVHPRELSVGLVVNGGRVGQMAYFARIHSWVYVLGHLHASHVGHLNAELWRLLARG